MHMTLSSLTAVACLFAAGGATSAAAAPVRAGATPAAVPMVQSVAYYAGYHSRRAAYWHHRRVERHEYHRWVHRR